MIQTAQPIESNAAVVAEKISPETDKTDENSDLETAEFKHFRRKFSYGVPVAVPVAAPVYIQPVPVQVQPVAVPVHYQPVYQHVHTPDCGCNGGGYNGGHSYGYNYNYHYNYWWMIQVMWIW